MKNFDRFLAFYREDVRRLLTHPSEADDDRWRGICSDEVERLTERNLNQIRRGSLSPAIDACMKKAANQCGIEPKRFAIKRYLNEGSTK